MVINLLSNAPYLYGRLHNVLGKRGTLTIQHGAFAVCIQMVR
jgi:hypothetical protein